MQRTLPFAELRELIKSRREGGSMPVDDEGDCSDDESARSAGGGAPPVNAAATSIFAQTTPNQFSGTAAAIVSWFQRHAPGEEPAAAAADAGSADPIESLAAVQRRWPDAPVELLDMLRLTPSGQQLWYREHEALSAERIATVSQESSVAAAGAGSAGEPSGSGPEASAVPCVGGRFMPFAADVDENLLVVAVAPLADSPVPQGEAGVFEWCPEMGLGDRLSLSFREFAEAYHAQLCGAPSVVTDERARTATAHAMEFVEGVGVMEVLCTLPSHAPQLPQ
jgi:hypothetical protein